MDFDVYFVFPWLYSDLLGHSKEHLAIDFDVVFAFSAYLDCLRRRKTDLCRELDCDIVAVLLPEWREVCSSVSPSVVHLVAEPYFEVARIPYPCLPKCLVERKAKERYKNK